MVSLLVGLALACPDAATDLPPRWEALTTADVLPELVASLPEWCTAARLDLDGDGAPDRAQLARQGATGAVLLLADRGRGWRILERRPPLPDSAAAWTLLRAKPAGTSVARDALPDSAALDARGAIEVCQPASVDGAGLPVARDPAALCHCSTFWTLAPRGRLTVCD